MTLLKLDDVRAALPGSTFGDDQLLVTMQLVAGWLRTATRLTSLPAPLPPDHDLYAPALELVALQVSNPEGLERSVIGAKARWWPQRYSRRDDILEELRVRYLRQRMAPSGEFPPPSRYPDEARPSAPRWWLNRGAAG